MAQRKKKVVFTAEPEQIEGIREVVRSDRYGSTSEFLRAAIDEKLMRIHRERLEGQVDRYCSEKYGDEESGLVEAQALDTDKT